jgi:hypothetical protein
MAARAAATSPNSLGCARAIRATTPSRCRKPEHRCDRRSIATRSPISDPLARCKNAERLKRDAMVKNHTTYFKPWDAIHESNPVEILQRREPVGLVPLLIMQGALDDNMLPAARAKFVAA